MNKQLFLLFLLGIISFTLYPQDFSKIDSIVYAYPTRYKHPKKLADQIAKDFSTDMEKAMAVYSWITKNISYSYKKLWKNDSDNVYYNDISSLKKYQEKMSKKVISKGYGVCEGYSQLFKTTCDYLKIPCFYVYGKSKTEISYDDTAHTFTSDPDTFYFGTAPEIFIKQHYPEFYPNSLLEEQISLEEFSNSPLHYSNTQSALFNTTEPANGVLYKKQQQVLFRYNQTIHSITYKLDDTKHVYTNEIEYDQGVIGLKFDLSKTEAKELVIFFDHTAVVGFKIE